jgi:hypothetical protein
VNEISDMNHHKKEISDVNFVKNVNEADMSSADTDITDVVIN